MPTNKLNLKNNWDYYTDKSSNINNKWIMFKGDKDAIVRIITTPRNTKVNGVKQKYEPLKYYWQYHDVYGHETTIEKAQEQITLRFLENQSTS